METIAIFIGLKLAEVGVFVVWCYLGYLFAPLAVAVADRDNPEQAFKDSEKMHWFGRTFWGTIELSFLTVIVVLIVLAIYILADILIGANWQWAEILSR